MNNRYVLIKAKWAGNCAECGDRFYAGDEIVYDTKESKAYDKECGKLYLESEQ